MDIDTELVLDIDEIEEETDQITKTYHIDFQNGCINGKVEGLEAVKQAIVKILLTERFKNLIYTDDYGCEVKDTMMSDENTDAFLESEIPELISDALSIDERILEVSNFEFSEMDETGVKDALYISFDVATIYGDMTMEVEI